MAFERRYRRTKLDSDRLFTYLFINQALLSATYTMTSSPLYIVNNCSNLNQISLTNAMICRMNKKVFSFFLKSLVFVISLMSTGGLFHDLGAATENARSDETSLKRGTTRSCLPAERTEARPGMLATGETNSVRYDGARRLTAWCTKKQSLNSILSGIGNQWSSYIAGATC